MNGATFPLAVVRSIAVCCRVTLGWHPNLNARRPYLLFLRHTIVEFPISLLAVINYAPLMLSITNVHLSESCHGVSDRIIQHEPSNSGH